MHPLKTLFAFTLAFTSLYAEVFTEASHDSSSHTSGLMLGVQAGYAWIDSKDTHMADDSGSMIGIHLMQHKHPKSDTKDCLNHRLSWAAGLHKTLTKDPHYGAMLGLMYALSPELTLSFMPGYIFMKHDNHTTMNHSSMGGMSQQMPNSMHSVDRKWSSEYASHIELTLSLKAFNNDFKPSFSWMTSDSHELYSLGLNFSF